MSNRQIDWTDPESLEALVGAARLMVDGHSNKEAAAHLKMSYDGFLRLRKRHTALWQSAWEEATRQSFDEPGSTEFNSRYSPGMNLAEFVETVYIPAAGCRRKQFNGRQLKKRRVEQCHYIVRLLTAYLRRPATVGDLTPATLEAFKTWHRTAFPSKSGKWLDVDCRAFLKFVRIVPDARTLNGRKSRQLSESPETLWGVALREYFPRNLEITSDKTKICYRQALCDLQEAIGKEPMPTDLTDDNVVLMMKWSMEKGHKPKTTNERRGRINALWTFMARRRLVEHFHANYRIPEPRRIPRAWTDDELARLFHSCRQEPGEVVPGVRASDWWIGLHWFFWSTGERKGAVFACRWEWLDWTTGYIQIDAEYRKGKDADFLHKVRSECLEALARMHPAGHELIFPWPYSEQTFYKNYKRILKRVGLPFDRLCMTHKMRKSVASHLQAHGVDACAALGHSSPDVTRKSYLDPRIVAPRSVADVLFNPEDVASPAIATLPEVPRLLEYRPRPEPEPELDPSLAWIA